MTTAPHYRDESVTVYHGDCLTILPELADNSIDAIITDPPYGLDFMGKHWDTGAVAFDTTVWAHCLRVLKPGGHLLAFGGSRTWHRLACAIEDAGFEIRDSIAWLYGSGFPKSLDVSRAIDKAAGVEREVVGERTMFKRPSLNGNYNTNGRTTDNYNDDPRRQAVRHDEPVTAPATDAARQWQGWGTALKPAYEPVVVARKPVIGTVAANVQKHGVGALNVDACRVGFQPGESTESINKGATIMGGMFGNGKPVTSAPTAGRWPANVVLDGDMADELDKQSGITSGQVGRLKHSSGTNAIYGKFERTEQSTNNNYTTDSGGASRFFPVFKNEEQQCIETPTTADSMSTATDADDAPKSTTQSTPKAGESTTNPAVTPTPDNFPTFRYTAKAPGTERPTADGTAHPTVKPLDLMRWLIRLVTPPHGLVLDCFAGTGTTGEAAIHEHKRAILIERETSYMPLIVARLHKPMHIGFDFNQPAEQELW